MPIYEYHCSGCAHTFEELIRNSREEARLLCPQCASSEVDRHLSVFSARGGRVENTHVPGSGCGKCSEQGSCPFSKS